MIQQRNMLAYHSFHIFSIKRAQDRHKMAEAILHRLFKYIDIQRVEYSVVHYLTRYQVYYPDLLYLFAVVTTHRGLSIQIICAYFLSLLCCFVGNLQLRLSTRRDALL
uniref:Predicted protein n=1 Tax=Hordeum vulgare subsp. vulgare TaxID=112509 RepID=F2CVE5_HORVV|nr:predicted protein [Hordeum vulgare subsp. vulgare]